MSAAGRRPRAVVLVADPAAPYSRGLRVARSLAAAGYEVEIAAIASPGLPREERDAEARDAEARDAETGAAAAVDASVVLRRYAPSGPFARFAVPGPGERRWRGPVRLVELLAKGLLWPIHVRGWWRTLLRDLPPADLYHACGILAVPVAIRLASAARAAGLAGRVVYDVVDVILESNNVAGVPAPLVAWYGWRERRWVRSVDAIVTVNDAIADHLAAHWHLATRPTVLLNCQPRWDPPAVRPDLIRAATGIPPGRSVVLFLGRLGRERGLEEAARAILQAGDAALVLLGFGPWAERLRERDRDPHFVGHHFTLPAVHPDEVPSWTASADASIVAVPANSLNQRLSSPNKFWESLTAGTPVVVGRDLEVMRSIVEADDLGAVVDPADPADVARGLRTILDASTEARDARRERCLRVTRERYNWETAVAPYLVLVHKLAAGDPVRAAEEVTGS